MPNISISDAVNIVNDFNYDYSNNIVTITRKSKNVTATIDYNGSVFLD
jgi:hypothetical protein